jgi:hypothetical protein
MLRYDTSLYGRVIRIVIDWMNKEMGKKKSGKTADQK